MAPLKLAPKPALAENLQAFLDDYKAQTTANPFDPRERVWKNVAGMEVSAWEGDIHISSIRSFEKGTGEGSKALEFLCQLADKHGVTLECEAEPFGEDKSFDQGKLVAWYKRHGFTGSEWEGMVRKPIGTKTATEQDQIEEANSFANEKAFMDHHNTGYIQSDAYENYEKDGGLDWEKLEAFPVLLKKVTLKDGTQVELRQSGRELKYTKWIDGESGRDVARGADGMALYLSPEEVEAKGYPAKDTAIAAFTEEGKTVGLASDEFGADGIWVVKSYQGNGLGTILLTEFRKQFGKGRRIGQMTSAGKAMARSYYNALKMKTADGPTKQKSPLEEEVRKFRLQREKELGWNSNPSCFKDICADESIDLIHYLKNKGFTGLKLIMGTYVFEDGDTEPHSWIRVGDKIVDITADQFHPGEEDKYRYVITDTSDPHYERRGFPRWSKTFKTADGPTQDQDYDDYITQTPAFKAWFGKSKVVDDHGRPLRVYRGEHGDSSEEFHTRAPGLSFGSQETANTYAESPNNRGDKPVAPRVYPCYLRIEKPFMNTPDDPFIDFSVVAQTLGESEAITYAVKYADYCEDTNNWVNEFSDTFSSVKDLLEQKPEEVLNLYMTAFPLLADHEFVSKLKALGYDGAIHGGYGENSGDVEYMVFDQGQVKSAIGNSGAFDPENRSIVAAERAADVFREENSEVDGLSLEEAAQEARRRVIGTQSVARNGDCVSVSSALCDILGSDATRTFGYYKNISHFWVTMGDTYIDPTHDQFRPPAIRIGKITDDDYKQDYEPRNGLGWRKEGEPKTAASTITETPAFKAWFSGSKVVNADGSPMVVYHGTKSSFDVFNTDTDEMGSHFGTISQAHHFTVTGETFREGANVIPCYLSIKKPLRLPDLGYFTVDRLWGYLTHKRIIRDPEEDLLYADPLEAARTVKTQLKAKGYDGIVYLNRREGEGLADVEDKDTEELDNMPDRSFKKQFPQAQDSWIAFEPHQIKSAIGNNGEFDPDKKEITASSKIAATEDLDILKEMLTLTDAQKGEELARMNPDHFRDWVEENHPESYSLFPDTYEEELDDYGVFPGAVLEDYVEVGSSYMHQHYPALAPSFCHMDFVRDVNDEWLVHFTDDASSVAYSGFTKGIDDPAMLGLTTYFKDEAKKRGGYNFAFDVADLRHWDGKKYGSECVLLRASGIEVYHYGDSEPQVIFWGADAHDRIPIIERDLWCVVQPEHPYGVMYEADKLEDAVQWGMKNYALYADPAKRDAWSKLYQDLLDAEEMVREGEAGMQLYERDPEQLVHWQTEKNKAEEDIMRIKAELGKMTGTSKEARNITGIDEHPELDGGSTGMPASAKVSSDNEGFLYHGARRGSVPQILESGIIGPDYSFWGDKRIAEEFAEGGSIFQLPVSRFEEAYLKPDKTMISDPYAYLMGHEDTEDDSAENIVYQEWEGSDKSWRSCLRLYGSVMYTKPIQVTRDDIIVGKPNMKAPKTAYISPKEAILAVAVDLGQHPVATITLDLGIPNFTVFSIKIPVEGVELDQIGYFIEQAVEAMLDEVSAYMITMGYSEAEVVKIYKLTLDCFANMGVDDATDAGMDADDNIRFYEASFDIPESFIEQTLQKVVTASGNVTDTPAFKVWFGDSKVVDEHGKPLTVYHGTDKDLVEFKAQGRKVGVPLAQLGFYFTSDADLAGDFSRQKWNDPESEYKPGANVLPVYLSIKNPLRMSPYRGMAHGNSRLQAKRFREELEAQGYDGIIIERTPENLQGEFRVEQYVAFRPHQIKSALGNNGEFDPSNHSITAASTQRLPPTRHWEFTTLKPRKDDPARTIQMYRSRSLKSTPRPYYVMLYDRLGRGVGVTKIPKEWESRLTKSL